MKTNRQILIRKKIAQIPKTIGLWLLRVVLLVLPVLPFFLLFLYIMSTARSLIYISLVLFSADLLFAVLWGREYKRHAIIHWLQLFVCWLPPAALVFFWISTIGEWIFLMLGWPTLLAVVAVYHRLRNRPLRREWRLHLIGFALVCATLAFNGMIFIYLLFFSVSVGLLVVILRALRRGQYLTFPIWLPLIVLTIYGACMFQAFFVYSVDERARRDEIVAQNGVQFIDLQEFDRYGFLDNLRGWIIRALIFPISDFSAFLTWRDSLLLLPQHLNTVVRLNKYKQAELLPADDVTADNIAIDFYRRKFYFVMGSQLFQGDFEGLKFKSVQTFNLVMVEHTTPNVIGGFFTAEAARVMVQYEYDNGVMVYDALTGAAWRMECGNYRIRNSIWHPDGDKIIAMGSNPEKSEGHLFSFDMQGNIVQDVVPHFRDLVFISPCAGRHFLLTHFITGRVEKWSVDTLQLQQSIPVSFGVRGSFEPLGSGCVVVPSFMRGTLEVYRWVDGKRLNKLQIGLRARSVQPSLEDEAFLVSTAAGLFKVSAAALLKDCLGPPNRTWMIYD